MELTYSNKHSKKEILDKLVLYKPLDINLSESHIIKGNNFDVLASLVASGYASKIDLVYIDPPYNTKQNFTFSEERVSTISRSASPHIAYRDNMSLASYLEFMRERLVVIRELLSQEGSIYVHIDNKMGHYLKIIMDEIFGSDNYKNDITRIKSNPKNFNRRAYGNQKDMILFYAKDYRCNIFNDVRVNLSNKEITQTFNKIDEIGRRYNTVPVHAPGETKDGKTGGPWRNMVPPKGRHWRTSPEELEKLNEAGLIEWSKNGVPRIKKHATEHKGKKVQDIWNYIDPAYPLYPTEKNHEMLEMIIAQSSNKDSIVLDCFAGSGSTLLAAQKLSRTWVGIDQSDFSIKVMKDRLDEYNFNYLDITK